MMKKFIESIRNFIKLINLKIDRMFKTKDMTRDEWKQKHRESRVVNSLVNKLKIR